MNRLSISNLSLRQWLDLQCRPFAFGFFMSLSLVTIKCKHNKEISLLTCRIFLLWVMQENASVIRKGQSLQEKPLIIPDLQSWTNYLGRTCKKQHF